MEVGEGPGPADFWGDHYAWELSTDPASLRRGEEGRTGGLEDKTVLQFPEVQSGNHPAAWGGEFEPGTFNNQWDRAAWQKGHWAHAYPQFQSYWDRLKELGSPMADSAGLAFWSFQEYYGLTDDLTQSSAPGGTEGQPMYGSDIAAHGIENVGQSQANEMNMLADGANLAGSFLNWMGNLSEDIGKGIGGAIEGAVHSPYPGQWAERFFGSNEPQYDARSGIISPPPGNEEPGLEDWEELGLPARG